MLFRRYAPEVQRYMRRRRPSAYSWPVSSTRHAVDVAGRPGIGFRHSVQPAAGAEEIIIGPHTYRLMGTATIARPSPGAAPRVLNGIAYLWVALVKGPGVMP